MSKARLKDISEWKSRPSSLILKHRYLALMTGLISGSLAVLPLQSAYAGVTASNTSAAVTADDVPSSPEVKSLGAVKVSAGKQGGDAQGSSVRVEGSQLEENQIHSLEDLQQLVPGLTVSAMDDFNTSLTIRGVGDGGGQAGGDVNIGMPSSVALYLDNVYLSRAGMLSKDLEDIDYVQVLSGALGNTFGPDSTGGVVDIHTRAPDATREGQVKFGMGQQGYFYEKAMFSGPVAPNWNARIDIYHANTDGSIYNVHDGRTLGGSIRSGARAQLVYSQSPFFNLRLIADYSQSNARPTGLLVATHAVDGVDGFATHAAALGITPYLGKRSVDIDDINRTHSKQAGASVEASWNFSNGYKLRWLSAFRYFRYKPTSADILSVPVYANSGTRVADRTWQSSLHLDSPQSDVFDYSVGLDYYGEKLRTVADTFYSDQAGTWYGSSSYNGLQVTRYGLLNESRYSVFLRGTWHISEKWDLTASARESRDRKGASFIRFNKAPFNSGYLVQKNYLPAAQMALNYAITPSLRAYVGIAYSEKSGGVNVSAGAAKKAGYGSLFLKPEKTKGAELGIQGNLDGGVVAFKADLFYAKVQDFQTQGYDPETLQTYLLNAGSFRSRGIEGNIQVNPNEHWSLQFATVYNNETYLDYDDARCPPEVSLSANAATSCNLTGKRVYNAPRFTVNVGARYGWSTAGGSDAYVSGRYSYRSWMYGTVDDSSFTRVPGYGVLSFSTGFSHRLGSGTLNTSLWINNALNKLYYSRLLNSDYGAVVGYIGSPRMVGITVSYDF